MHGYPPASPAAAGVHAQERWHSLASLGASGARDALTIALAAARRLDELHREGRTHGDLCPETISVRWTQPPELRLEPAAAYPSLAHRAPEHFRALDAAPDARADLYSLGVTLYQLVSGRLPLSAGDALGWAHAHLAIEPAPLDPAAAPSALGRVIMKLLAKDPEARYQTARGLERDLERCLASPGDAFVPADEVPSVLRPPRRLFGRDAELNALSEHLIESVERAALGVVVLTGEAGVGKSSLIRAFQRRHTESLWGIGRADSLRRGEPYLVFGEALAGIVQGLFALPDDRLMLMREDLVTALGDGARTLAELVPDLERLVGPVLPAVRLGAAEARARLHYLVASFLRLVSRVTPVVVVIDDLHAADEASLDLLRQLVTDPELHASPLLILVALREQEAAAAEQVRQLSSALRSEVSLELRLTSLTQPELEALIDEIFRCGRERAGPLAALVFAKTLGNPFYALQFIRAAAERGLIWIERDVPAWRWDLDRLAAERPADNVADLLVGRVRRLPRETAELLALAACLGHDIDAARLARLSGRNEAATRALLEALARADLLMPIRSAYRFMHDRVREVAYTLLDPSQRPATHLAIGQDLLVVTAPDALVGRVFEIASHLEQAAPLLQEPDQRARFAEVLLVAARTARTTGALSAAATYCAEALAILGEGAWSAHPELAFELTLTQARSAWPTGDFDTSKRLVGELLSRVKTRAQRTQVLRERIEICVACVDVINGIQATLEALRLFDMTLEFKPDPASLVARHQRIVDLMKGREIESLADLPFVTDPDLVALMDVLRTFTVVAFAIDRSVRDLFALEMMELTLMHGLSEASPVGIAFYGAFLAERLHEIDLGVRWARLARALGERPELRAVRSRVCSVCVLVEGWKEPPSHLVEIARTGVRAALANGDQISACLNLVCLAYAGAAQGAPLASLLADVERGLTKARELGFDFARLTLEAARQWIRALRGETFHVSRFDDPGFEEAQLLEGVETRKIVLATFNVHVLLMQARYLGGDLPAAWELAVKLRKLRQDAVVASPLVVWAGFFAALIALARAEEGADRDEALAVVRDEDARLSALVDRAEGNFLSKHLVVRAASAVLEGRRAEALPLLERAAAAASSSGFVHDEAIAHELAARVAARLGLSVAATAYRARAYDAYARWGAEGKLRLMEADHPDLAERGGAADDTMNAALESLVATKVADAMGAEMASPRLARMLMQVVLEYAGARRAVLALTRPSGLALVASFDVERRDPDGMVEVRDQLGAPHHDGAGPRIGEREAPLSILRYVFRSRKRLYLPDASSAGTMRFAADPYFVGRKKARSILCVPIARTESPLGVLYVENDLVAGAFTATRVALIEHVAAQAAVTFENARLFRELEAAEARLMTLVAHAPIAVWASDAEGVMTFARGRALAPLTPDPHGLVGATVEEAFRQAWWLLEATRSALAGHATGASGPVGQAWLEAQVVPLFDEHGRVSGHTGMAVDVTARARLTEDLRALASQLSTVEDAERRQLARDLHDSVAQGLLALKLELETLVAPGLESRLRPFVHRLGEAHQQVRTVMFELYPTMLDDLGLGPTLVHYARVLAAEGLEVSVTESGSRAALATDRSAFLFRAAKELLRNIVKHARARRALVTLSWREGALRLAVADDGRGFDATVELLPGSRRGFGLFDLRERVTHYGGRMRIESAAGAGTEVLIDLPLDGEHALPSSRPTPRPQDRDPR